MLDVFADAASVVLLSAILYQGRKPVRYPMQEAASRSKEKPLWSGVTPIQEANNLAVLHMRSAYRHPMADHALFRGTLWLAYGLTAAGLGLFFVEYFSLFWGNKEPLLPLYSVWSCAALFGAFFAALYAGSYVVLWRKGETRIFWSTRCRLSLQNLIAQFPDALQRIKNEHIETVPWWWLFSRNRQTLIVKAAYGLFKTAPFVGLGVTLFLGWYSVMPPLYHEPAVGAVMVFAAMLEILMFAGLFLFLFIELSAWQGATNKTYPTFSMSVFQHDIRDGD